VPTTPTSFNGDDALPLSSTTLSGDPDSDAGYTTEEAELRAEVERILEEAKKKRKKDAKERQEEARRKRKPPRPATPATTSSRTTRSRWRTPAERPRRTSSRTRDALRRPSLRSGTAFRRGSAPRTGAFGGAGVGCPRPTGFRSPPDPARPDSV
jgi:hypothetical protein